jgi:hypothetical protein
MEWMSNRDRSLNDAEKLGNIKLSPKHTPVNMNIMN